jgi:hypothetical protein
VPADTEWTQSRHRVHAERMHPADAVFDKLFLGSTLRQHTYSHSITNTFYKSTTRLWDHLWHPHMKTYLWLY